MQIIRGIDGGCRLAADLHRVSLFDLIEIMEEDMLINACMQSNFQCSWRKKYGSHCMIHKNLQQIQKAIDAELRAHSLHQMLFGDN